MYTQVTLFTPHDPLTHSLFLTLLPPVLKPLAPGVHVRHACAHCVLSRLLAASALHTARTLFSMLKLQHTTYHTGSSHFTLPTALGVYPPRSLSTLLRLHTAAPTSHRAYRQLLPACPSSAPATELKDHTLSAPFHPHSGRPSTSR